MTGSLIGAATLLVINHVVVRYLYRHARLERFVEGDPDVLIENGVVRTDALRHELITLTELEAAAYKQGFGSLDEVERAVLEPGGSIAFVARRLTPDVQRHEELLARLDALQSQVAGLRS